MPHGFLAVETMTDQMNSLNLAGVMCSYKETKLNGKKSPAEMFFVLFLMVTPAFCVVQTGGGQHDRGYEKD